MKKILFISTLLYLFTNATAQRGPLNGSGTIIKKTYEETGFDKVELKDLPGNAIIETGKPFSLQIDIDDNLVQLLVVNTENGTLKIKFEGNQQNKLYIENTHVLIRISLPVIQALEHRGNNDVALNGLTGTSFRLENYGNGNTVLSGSIEKLWIRKSGNGDVNAAALLAQEADIKSSGNGDVLVNAAIKFDVTASGNGDVKNTGTALVGEGSSRSGNGDIIDKAWQPKQSPYPAGQEDTRIKTRIQNNTGKRVELKIVYPVKGSYGIEINAGGLQKEYFPLGTKIYMKGKNDNPLFEITPENRDTVLVIEN